MFSIDKRQVDWQKEFEDWDLSCPFCHGEDEQEECEDCYGTGFVEPIWNTVWEIGFLGGRDVISEETVKEVIRETNCLVLFNHEEGKWYLTLSGCGMDLTPELCYAWLLLGFEWLPLEWAESLHVDYAANLSRGKFDRVLEEARKTLRTASAKCEYLQLKLERKEANAL